MHPEYTPEEVAKLLAEHEPLEYGPATAAELAEATDVLEGVEELIAGLATEDRYGTVEPVCTPIADLAWVPVANNCSRSAGVTVSPEGAVSFAVRDRDEQLTSYFAARQAIDHALLGLPRHPAGPAVEVAGEFDTGETIPGPSGAEVPGEESLVTLLRENGWAVAAGRTLADVDKEILAQAYHLSEAGVAHLFAESGGLVLAMAGSTREDRRRAVAKLPTLSERSYASRSFSGLFDCRESGVHYSERESCGQAIKGAPEPEKELLDSAGERFRASRFVRPRADRPLDHEAIRRCVRRTALVRAAVKYALVVDPADATETVLRTAAALLVGRLFSRMVARRALDAERTWDTEAERNRMAEQGSRLRREIAAARKERGRGQPTYTTAHELDEARAEDAGTHWAEAPALRCSIKWRRKSGRAAYDTARAVYLRNCPGLERKLLHLLRRDGVQPETEFLSRHRNLAADTSFGNPEAAIRTSLRQLAEAGKIRRVRSQKTGEVFLVATEPLDETGYRRSLNALISDGRFGIVNPWTETVGVDAEDEQEDLVVEETGRQTLLGNVADESAQEELEALTA